MQEMHPDWEYKLRGHDEIFNDLYKDDEFIQYYIQDPDLYKYAFICDRIRLLLLRDFGGVYCDLDCKPIKSFNTVRDGLTDKISFFCGMKPSQDNNTLMDCTVYGSAPNSRMVQELLSCYHRKEWAHGCKTFNNKIIQTIDDDVAVFGFEYFYGWKITDKAVVLHDVEETRLFSWVEEQEGFKKEL